MYAKADLHDAEILIMALAKFWAFVTMIFDEEFVNALVNKGV